MSNNQPTIYMNQNTSSGLLIAVTVIVVLLIVAVIILGVYSSKITNKLQKASRHIPRTRTSQVEYTITQTDIDNGYSIVPITWHRPWEHTHYTSVFSIVNANPVTLSLSPGNSNNYTHTGFDAIVEFTGPQPQILQSINHIAITSDISSTTPISVSGLYSISIYIASHNNGLNTQAVQTYISYTDASGSGVQTFGFPVIGQIAGSGVGPLNSQNFNLPLYCIAGSNITITTGFVTYGTDTPIGGSFTYDFSSQISNYIIGLQSPIAGDQFIVNAISIEI
jgi:hypothetical protein